MHRSTWLTYIPFVVVSLSVAVGFHLYLYRRLVKGMTDSRRIRALGVGAFVLLGALIMAGPIASRMYPTSRLGQAGYLWFAVAFYLFTTLLLVDLAFFLARLLGRVRKAAPPAPPAPQGPESVERRVFLARAARTSASLAAVGVTGFGFQEAWAPARITEVPVKLPRLPPALSGLTLAQLTDIHVGAWIDRRFIEDLVARTNSIKADAVFITGDLVDGSVADLRSMVAPLARLRSRFGTYFVTGNHEYYSGVDEWCAELERMGITVLRNRHVALGDPSASLDLVGVDDWNGGRGMGQSADLKKATAGRDPSRAAILLAHQPKGVEQAAAAGIGLQLSGHTHGGQIWPWSYAVRLAYPFFKGRYQVGEMTLYVSNGCGLWGPPVRVLAPPEVVKVVLG
ncbi:MAG: metallophosphoesterase [Myxococcales bacterium]